MVQSNGAGAGHPGLYSSMCLKSRLIFSREDALRFFKANPFFNAWDPTVLNLYVEHGIRPSPDGNGVQLKMNGIQEATVFADYWTSNDAYGLLPALDPRIPIQWVLPDTQK
jgi:hypothetical protein